MTFSGTVEIPYDYKIVRYIGDDEALVLHQIKGSPSFKRDVDTLITVEQYNALTPYLDLFADSSDTAAPKRGRKPSGN